MRRMLSFISALLIGLSSGGKSVETNPKQFSLEMSRTACYGSCPIYILKVDSGGKVEFKGIEFTETIGKVESLLTEEKIKQFSNEIQKSNFFSLEDNFGYESKNCFLTQTDSSGVLLTIEFDGKRKTIDHYQGCLMESRFWQENPLGRLSKFENKIDEIVETKRWVGERK